MTFAERLKLARTAKGLSQKELAQQVFISQQAYAKYEAGKSTPYPKTLAAIAEVLGVSADALLGSGKNLLDLKMFDFAPTIAQKTHKYPVIGEVAAGYDHLAVEDIEGDTVEIPDSYLRGRDPSEFFVLRVKGESMFPMYQDGDLVLVLKQATCNRSGDIAVVIYDDEAASLKKVEYVMGEDWMKLLPLNQSYPPIRIEGERLEHCKVIGLPKMLIRNLEE